MKPFGFILGFVIIMSMGMVSEKPTNKVSQGTRPSQKASYEVSKASGVLLYRQASSPKWKRLKKGRQLFDGDLIQVTNGAKLQLSKLREKGAQPNASSDRGLDRSTIVVASPVIFRVGPHMVRRLHLSQFFVKDIPEKSATQAVKRDLSYHFDEAWKKMSLVFSGKTDPASKAVEPDFSLFDANISVGMAAHKLRILAPADKSIFQSAQLPLEVKVSWTAAEGHNQDYKLFVWEPFQTKPDTPTAVTRETFHTIQLPSYGSFYIQVSTVDDEWASPVNIAHLISTDSANGLSLQLKDSSILAAQKLAVASIEPIFPSEGLHVYMSDPKTAVSFSWSYVEEGSVDTPEIKHESELIIENRKGKRLLRQKVSGMDARIILRPGSYQWYVVDALHPARRSETRELTVKHVGANEEAIRAIVQPGISGTFDLVSGLSLGTEGG